MRKHAILMLFTLGCSATEETKTTEAPINNGFKPGGFEPTVFLHKDPKGTCTSTNIRYPRCIVTASHCVTTPSYVAAGQHPDSSSKRQSPAKFDQRPNTIWTDIAVEWLEAKTPGSIARLVPTTDYVPMGLGIPTAPATLFRKSTELGTKSGLPLAAIIIGYGEDHYGNLGTKAIGVGNITAFHQGSKQSTALTGSIIRVDPGPGLGQIGCPGDSGGPVWPAGAGWQSFGVLSRRSYPENNEACYATESNFYTAFDDDGVNGAQGNYSWTSDTMERLCTQWLNVKVEGQGSVAGDILPKQRKDLGIENNDKIACPGDCIENFHQIDSPDHRAPQIMNIVATPSQGWRFKEWKGESIKRKCQCPPSEASCWVKQQPMGYYTQDESIDEDTCIAVFVQDNDGGTDGGYDSGMGDPDSGMGDPDSGSSDAPDGGAPMDSSDGGVDASDED